MTVFIDDPLVAWTLHWLTWLALFVVIAAAAYAGTGGML